MRDYRRMAAAVRSAEPTLRAEVRKTIREQVPPIGLDVVTKGVEGLPGSYRGGLKRYLSEGPKVRVNQSSSSVSMTLSNRHNSHLGSMDHEGHFRHPVFASHSMSARAASKLARSEDSTLKGAALRRKVNSIRRDGWTWTGQSIQSGTWDKALEGHRDELAAAIGETARGVLNSLEGNA